MKNVDLNKDSLDRKKRYAIMDSDAFDSGCVVVDREKYVDSHRKFKIAFAVFLMIYLFVGVFIGFKLGYDKGFLSSPVCKAIIDGAKTALVG